MKNQMNLKEILTVLLFLRKNSEANQDLIKYYEGKRQESLEALRQRVNLAMMSSPWKVG